MGAITDNARTAYSDGPISNPKKPNKHDIIRLFALIDGSLSSVVNGLLIGNAVVYSTRSQLYADLAHPAGRLGVVYGDSNTSYIGIYVKSGASGSGSWSLTNLALPSSFAAQLADVVSSLNGKADQEDLDNVVTELASKADQEDLDVVSEEVEDARSGAGSLSDRLANIYAAADMFAVGSADKAYYDHNGLIGTARTLYLPRNLAKQVGGSAFNLSNIGTESAVWPGRTELVIANASLYTVRLDADSPSAGYVATVYGSALPNAAASQIVVGWVRDGQFKSDVFEAISIEGDLGAVWSTLPIAIEDGVVCIPRIISVNPKWTDDATLAGAPNYRDFAFPDSTTDARTLYFDHAAYSRGAECLKVANYPRTPLSAAARPLITAFRDQIIALGPLQLVGKKTGNIQRNEMYTGKNVEREAEVVYETAAKTPITGAQLTALGFTHGYSDPANDRVFVGCRFADRSPGQWLFARFYVQSDVASDFGTNRWLFWEAEDGSLSQIAEQFVVEKELSSTERSYIIWSKMPTNKKYQGAIVGAQHGTGRNFRICGVQIAYGSALKSWISRDDYPAPDQSANDRSKAVAAASATPVSPIVRFPKKLHVIAGLGLPLYAAQLGGGINEGTGLKLTLAGKDGQGRAMVKTSSTGDLHIDGIVGQAEILLRAIRGRSEARSRVLTEIVSVDPAALAGKSVKVHLMGDSLVDWAGSAVVLERQLADLDLNVSMIGTFPCSQWEGDPANQRPAGGPTSLAEGRTGRRFSDFINETTSQLTPLPAGQEAAYLAMSPSMKRPYNPYLRAATGSDPAGLVYNGYTFDFAFYLSRFGLAAPDVVIINLSTNDYRLGTMAVAGGWIDHGLNVIYTRVRAALPNAAIAFVANNYGRGVEGDVFWGARVADFASRVDQFVTGKADAKLHWLAVSAHMSSEAGYPLTVSSTSGTSQTAIVNDTVHFVGDGAEQHAAPLAALCCAYAA